MERAVMVIEEGKQVVEKERSITECECVPDSEQTCTESDQSSSEPEQSSPEPTLSSEQPITETESSQSQDFTDWEHAQIVLEQARSTLLTPSILSQVESAVRDQVTPSPPNYTPVYRQLSTLTFNIVLKNWNNSCEMPVWRSHVACMLC